jgi:hypothetical protein
MKIRTDKEAKKKTLEKKIWHAKEAGFIQLIELKEQTNTNVTGTIKFQ